MFYGMVVCLDFNWDGVGKVGKPAVWYIMDVDLSVLNYWTAEQFSLLK